MHPNVFWKWKQAKEAARHYAHVHAHGHCGHRGDQPADEELFEASAAGGDSPFGVRRPLRFMAFKLELDEDQVKQLAQILNTLKTERAQAAVDEQRSVAAFADVLEQEVYDPARVDEALKRRVEAAERLAQAVSKALAKTHAMLRPDQRTRLTYLLRSGQLTI